MTSKKYILPTFFLLMSSPLYSQSQTSFNLVCKGTTLINDYNIPEMSEYYRDIFVIDLKSGRYCKNKCTQIYKIHKIDNINLTIQDSVKEEVDRTITEKESINRETGSHFWSWDEKKYGFRSGSISMTKFGFCEKVQFTGFPNSGRKF